MQQVSYIQNNWANKVWRWYYWINRNWKKKRYNISSPAGILNKKDTEIENEIEMSNKVTFNNLPGTLL